jgi:N-acylglucosamine 2-epimerase
MSFPELSAFYRNHLLKQVLPFWTGKCIDWEYGGITNAVADDGTILSTDKFMWSQGRALWTFSALYNEIERDPDWLLIADSIAGFVMKHGWGEDGLSVYSTRRDGGPLESHKSIYADAFLIYGLTEYARASGREEPLRRAVKSFEKTSPLLRDHSKLMTEPHPIPKGVQSHGPSMIFALAYHELGVLSGDERILKRARELADIVMTQHLHPQHKVLYEFVLPGGGLLDSDAGKTFLPGHAIECMWFMEKIYRHSGCPDRIDAAFEAIRRHLEKGWDKEYGGLFLACHTEGGKAVWHQPEAKIWWPHTEALFALLRTYEVTRRDWSLDWYWKIHDYAFTMFPNLEHGEWFHNLDRQGRRIRPILKNLAVKDPFHLPRALIYSIGSLERIGSSRD